MSEAAGTPRQQPLAPRAAHLVVDCADLDRVARFWSALLGLQVTSRDHEWVDLQSLGPGGPVLSFQRVPEDKTVKNRLHLDLATGDVIAAGERARSLGATPAGALHGASGASPWQVWRDVEGNEFCLVTG